MHTTTFARTGLLVFALCAVCVISGESVAQDFKTVHDGVEYAKVEHKLGSDPVRINLLRLDLTKVRLDVHHAMDAAIGTEKTSSIATRHGAVAAINTGFFRLDTSKFAGEAAGFLMIDGRLLSESLNDRSTLIISNQDKETQVFFGNYRTEIWLGDGDRRVMLSGINRERKTGEAVIYDVTSAPSAERRPGDFEIRLTQCSQRRFNISSDRYIDCRRADVANDPVPPERGAAFVILMDQDFLKANAVKEVVDSQQRSGSNIAIGSRMKDGSKFFAYTDRIDVTNGVSHLIREGNIRLTWEQERSSRAFAETRHPRTAVANLKDGKFLMMTVDGRQPGVSVGMTLQELAEYLLSLGAVDAMNLDGGGSTTMFLDGKVVNTPSDKDGERKVGDAILVTLRKRVGATK